MFMHKLLVNLALFGFLWEEMGLRGENQHTVQTPHSKDPMCVKTPNLLPIRQQNQPWLCCTSYFMDKVPVE